MRFTTFGRTEHRLLSAAITKALEDIGNEFGVDLVAGGGQIGPGMGRVHIDVKIRPAVGGIDPAKAMWDRMCIHYGLKPEHFGATFHTNGRLYRITGITTSRPKYPIDCVRVVDNQPFKFPVSTIAAKLPMKVAA